MPIIIDQNLIDLGWKFFSASSYSLTGSSDCASPVAFACLISFEEAVEDIIRRRGNKTVLRLEFLLTMGS
jgi:hypothetical protein